MTGNKPYLIGVAGGTTCGKTSVCKKIVELLGENNVKGKVAIISQESFYKPLNKQETEMLDKNMYNFDHPDAFDTKLMVTAIKEVVAGKKVTVPVYDTQNYCRVEGKCHVIEDCDVVLFEGILVFYHEEVRNLFNMKLFVDIDADTRLSRRVLRDVMERGRSLETILMQYTTYVKPAFEEFCLPTKKFADIVIPRGSENNVAVDLIVQHILNGDNLANASTNGINGNYTIKPLFFKKQVNGNHKNVNGKSNQVMMNGKLHNGDSCINGLTDEVDAIKIVHH